MAKVSWTDFTQGLTRKWYDMRSGDFRTRVSKPGELLYGCVNPFIYPGFLVTGSSTFTAVINETNILTNDRILAWCSVDDNIIDSVSGTSTYFTQGKYFNSLSTQSGTVTIGIWPLSLEQSGTSIYSGAPVDQADGITDYQINGIRKQFICFRYNAKTNWDFATWLGRVPQTFTVTIASPAVFTCNSHGLIVNSRMRFTTTGLLPTGLSLNTTYYVITAGFTANTFQVSTSEGGTVVNTSGTQSGVHTIGITGALFNTAMSSAVNYASTIIDPAVRIVNLVADNGFMYFGNRNHFNKFDGSTSGGANGTITPDVLTLSKSRAIIDAIDGAGNMWILTRPNWVRALQANDDNLTSTSREISVLIWDRQSTNVNISDNIRIEDVQDAYFMYMHDSNPYVFTKGANKIVQLRAYNGKKFVIVAEIANTSSGSTYQGIPASKNSIVPYMNGFLWQDLDGNIYWYGDTNPIGEEGLRFGLTLKKSFFWVGRNITATSGLASSIIPITGSRIAIAYSNSDLQRLRIWDGMDSGSAASDITTFLPPLELPKLSTIMGVTIFFADIVNVSTGTIPVDIYNSYTKTTAPNKVSTIIDLDVDIPRGWLYIPVSMINSNVVIIGIGSVITETVGSSPQIQRIEVEYEQTSKRR